MFENIVNNLSTIFKANETKEFAKQSVENIAKVCLVDDIESGVKEVGETIKYIGSIKDILFGQKQRNG